MPCLDIQVWVEKGEILHEFYSKPMSSPYTIMFNSAISGNIKRNTILQEGLRRIKLTHQKVAKLKIKQILTEFANRLRISGYDHKYRFTAMKGILEAYKIFNNEVEKGEKVRYRSNKEIKIFKEGKLGQFTNTWFLTGNITNTVQIQATPGSELRNRVQTHLKTELGPDGGSIKAIEMGGKSVLSGLKKSPNSNNICPYKNKCLTSNTSDCMQDRVVYQAICVICEKERNSGPASGQPEPCMNSQHETRQSSTEPNSGRAEVNPIAGSQLRH